MIVVRIRKRLRLTSENKRMIYILTDYCMFWIVLLLGTLLELPLGSGKEIFSRITRSKFSTETRGIQLRSKPNSHRYINMLQENWLFSTSRLSRRMHFASWINSRICGSKLTKSFCVRGKMSCLETTYNLGVKWTELYKPPR